ncbi:MAG: Rrf2 family transcriptional regulator [Desulfovibrio sp.]|nr:Rrf2 family transcriptional regulator [Desulfovibrio sp.]
MIFIHLSPVAGLTSKAIATSLHANDSWVRLLMAKLKRAGLLQSVIGHPRPSLAREPSAISLLDVYRAVEGDKRLLYLDTHVNPQCTVGVNIQKALGHAYADVQAAAEAKMQAITLADILEAYRRAVSTTTASQGSGALPLPV